MFLVVHWVKRWLMQLFCYTHMQLEIDEGCNVNVIKKQCLLLGVVETNVRVNDLDSVCNVHY